MARNYTQKGGNMINLSNWIKPSRWSEFQNVKIGILPRFEDNGFKDTDFERLVGEHESPFHHPVYDMVFNAIDDAMTECEHKILSGAAAPADALDGAFYYIAAFAAGGTHESHGMTPQYMQENAEAQMVMLYSLHQSVLAYWKRLDDDPALREYASWNVIRHMRDASARRHAAVDIMNTVRTMRGPAPQ